MRFVKKCLAILLVCTASASYAAEKDNFTLSSPVAFNQGQFPELYTCDGENISPKLVWFGAPAKTQSFALIMSDPDAPSGTFYHWVLYNMPNDTAKLDKAVKTLPPGTLVGMNSQNKAEYHGPCPPKGPRHHYIFTLYALDKKLDLTAGADAKAVEDAMQNHIMQQVDMTVLYGR
jgi:Raf kinase inhibitor-like YbhB/YbcL family protein